MPPSHPDPRRVFWVVNYTRKLIGDLVEALEMRDFDAATSLNADLDDFLESHSDFPPLANLHEFIQGAQYRDEVGPWDDTVPLNDDADYDENGPPYEVYLFQPGFDVNEELLGHVMNELDWIEEQAMRRLRRQKQMANLVTRRKTQSTNVGALVGAFL